jgi:hypothetical protein
MDDEHNNNPKDDKPATQPQRFAGAIEIDTDSHEDPDHTLELALTMDEDSRILGAYRLATVQGRRINIPRPLALKLAEHLEKAEMFTDAARVYRQAAEQDLASADSADAIFRAACLLLGPAFKAEPGADLLLYLVSNYPDHALAVKAEQIFELHQAGNEAALQKVLDEVGVFPRPPERIQEAYELINARPPPEGRYAALRYKLAPIMESAGYKTASRIFKVLGLVVLGVFIYAWLMHDNLRSVEYIDPALKLPPIQTPIENAEPIRLVQDGNSLKLTPLFDYEISGLIVSIDDYTMFGLSRGNLFMQDLCMIWGGNVRRGVHRNPGVTFEHAGNVCYAKWTCQANVRGSELSNSHILVVDDDLRDAFDDLARGDQIRIKGQLVDVLAQPVDQELSHRRAGPQKLKTSTKRTDKGRGACEIILARELEVLIAGSPTTHLLYKISFWLLILFGAGLLARFFLLPVGRNK